MKGVFFGYVEFSNCEACGAPRYAKDYDDDCVVLPGRLEIAPPTCDYRFDASALKPWHRLDQMVCPRCGGKLLRDWSRDEVYCENARRKVTVHEVDGCPHCSFVSSAP